MEKLYSLAFYLSTHGGSEKSSAVDFIPYLEVYMCVHIHAYNFQHALYSILGLDFGRKRQDKIGLLSIKYKLMQRVSCIWYLGSSIETCSTYLHIFLFIM